MSGFLLIDLAEAIGTEPRREARRAERRFRGVTGDAATRTAVAVSGSCPRLVRLTPSSRLGAE